MNDLPTTSYGILGLLAREPQSGHQLSGLAGRSIAYFWSIPRSLVYRELARLEKLGLVEGTEIAQEKLPDKREYRLTDAGRRALVRWLNEPGYETGRSKDGFLVKFFFGQLLEEGSRSRLLEEYRLEAEAYLEDLIAIVAKLETDQDAVYRRLTALRGVRAAEAQLRWIEDVEAAFRSSRSRKRG